MFKGALVVIDSRGLGAVLIDKKNIPSWERLYSVLWKKYVENCITVLMTYFVASERELPGIDFFRNFRHRSTRRAD